MKSFHIYKYGFYDRKESIENLNFTFDFKKELRISAKRNFKKMEIIIIVMVKILISYILKSLFGL